MFGGGAYYIILSMLYILGVAGKTFCLHKTSYLAQWAAGVTCNLLVPAVVFIYRSRHRQVFGAKLKVFSGNLNKMLILEIKLKQECLLKNLT